MSLVVGEVSICRVGSRKAAPPFSRLNWGGGGKGERAAELSNSLSTTLLDGTNYRYHLDQRRISVVHTYYNHRPELACTLS